MVTKNAIFDFLKRGVSSVLVLTFLWYGTPGYTYDMNLAAQSVFRPFEIRVNDISVLEYYIKGIAQLVPDLRSLSCKVVTRTKGEGKEVRFVFSPDTVEPVSGRGGISEVATVPCAIDGRRYYARISFSGLRDEFTGPDTIANIDVLTAEEFAETALPPEAIYRTTPTGAIKDTVRCSLVFLSKPANPRKVAEPLGLESIAGRMREDFGDSVVISGTVAHRYPAIDEVIQKIRSEKPDVLGLSLYFGTMGDLDRIMGSLHDLPPDERPVVLLGNVLATHNCEMLLEKYPEVVICRGDGELAASGIIGYVRGERELSAIPNIAYRNPDGTVHYAAVEIPPITVPERFSLQDVIESNGKAYLETSRGCPHNCFFCERRAFFGHGRIEKPLPAVMREIQLLDQSGFKAIDIIDEDFIADNPERTIEFARMVIEMKAKGEIDPELTFFIPISVRAVYNKNLSEEANDKKRAVLELLKKAGVTNCFIGIESGSPGQLRRLGKAQTIEESKRATKILQEVGIIMEPGFIMFDPMMTPEEVLENVSFLNETGLFEHISDPMSQLRVPINTQIYNKALEKGLIIEGSYDPDWLSFDYYYERADTADIVRHAKEFESGVVFIEDLLKRVFRSNNFYTLSPQVQAYVFDNKKHITKMFVDLIGDLASCAIQHDRTFEEVMDEHNEIMVRFLQDLLADGYKAGVFEFCEDLEERAEALLAKRAILRYFRNEEFRAEDLVPSTGLTKERIEEVLEALAGDREIESLPDGRYRVTEAFFALRLALPTDYPHPAKPGIPDDDPHRATPTGDGGDAVNKDGKTSDNKRLRSIAEAMKETCEAGDETAVDEQTDLLKRASIRSPFGDISDRTIRVVFRAAAALPRRYLLDHFLFETFFNIIRIPGRRQHGKQGYFEAFASHVTSELNRGSNPMILYAMLETVSDERRFEQDGEAIIPLSSAQVAGWIEELKKDRYTDEQRLIIGSIIICVVGNSEYRAMVDYLLDEVVVPGCSDVRARAGEAISSDDIEIDREIRIRALQFVLAQYRLGLAAFRDRGIVAYQFKKITNVWQEVAPRGNGMLDSDFRYYPSKIRELQTYPRLFAVVAHEIGHHYLDSQEYNRRFMFCDRESREFSADIIGFAILETTGIIDAARGEIEDLLRGRYQAGKDISKEDFLRLIINGTIDPDASFALEYQAAFGALRRYAELLAGPGGEVCYAALPWGALAASVDRFATARPKQGEIIFSSLKPAINQEMALLVSSEAVRGGAQRQSPSPVSHRDSVPKAEDGKADRATPTGEVPQTAIPLRERAERDTHDLVGCLFNLAVNHQDGEKVVLALDKDLGKDGSANYVARVIGQLAALKTDERFERLFRDIVIVQGHGKALAHDVARYIDEGMDGEKIKEENIIMVTRSSNEVYCAAFKDRSVITFVDDAEIGVADYYPLLEITLFTLAKSLYRQGIRLFDEDELRELVRGLPMAISNDDQIIPVYIDRNVVTIVLRPAEGCDYDELPRIYEGILKALVAA